MQEINFSENNQDVKIIIIKTKSDLVNIICKLFEIEDKSTTSHLFNQKNKDLELILKGERPIYKKRVRKKPKLPIKKPTLTVTINYNYVGDIFTKFEKKLLTTQKVSNLLEQSPEEWYPKYKKWKRTKTRNIKGNK